MPRSRLILCLAHLRPGERWLAGFALATGGATAARLEAVAAPLEAR